MTLENCEVPELFKTNYTFKSSRNPFFTVNYLILFLTVSVQEKIQNNIKKIYSQLNILDVINSPFNYMFVARSRLVQECAIMHV